jgi:hypothetical protein
MGFLGLCLLFVGIALIMNGVAAISNGDAKTTAFINLVTGSILVIGNFIGLAKAGVFSLADCSNSAGGFLFGVTCLFIAFHYLAKLDLRAFGWHRVCVAIFASSARLPVCAAARCLWGRSGWGGSFCGWKKGNAGGQDRRNSKETGGNYAIGTFL